MTINDKINTMIYALLDWMEKHDYNYMECNYIPENLQTTNRMLNMLWRTFFRLCPFNFRGSIKDRNGRFPNTPQSNVAMIKAFDQMGNIELCRKIYERLISLKSSKTNNFALKQGITISINLYENTPEDPTPLNTVWFGEFLINDNLNLIPEIEKKNLLYSICDYLINELGYKDFGENGIYFYYGPTLKKVIYNASAIISSFLLDVGNKYDNPKFKALGEQGIIFIINNQNQDGSWYYAASPERPTIDCFHQSYILQALIRAKKYLSFNIEESIKKGDNFYRGLFKGKNEFLIPQRYDKRFRPHNTWLFQKYDGRDISEALIYFSIYSPDLEKIKGLVNLLYEKLFNKQKNYISPEKFIYGKNHIPYIEFQGWYLYSLTVLRHYLDENNIIIS